MLDPNALAAIRLSIELSILATLILLVAGTPLAWWIARGRSPRWNWLRVPVRALVAMPLVLLMRGGKASSGGNAGADAAAAH